jgi:hypothetical protein
MCLPVDTNFSKDAAFIDRDGIRQADSVPDTRL